LFLINFSLFAIELYSGRPGAVYLCFVVQFRLAINIAQENEWSSYS